MKNIFLSENFQFFEMKFSIYLNRRVYVMQREYSEEQPQSHTKNDHYNHRLSTVK